MLALRHASASFVLLTWGLMGAPRLSASVATPSSRPIWRNSGWVSHQTNITFSRQQIAGLVTQIAKPARLRVRDDDRASSTQPGVTLTIQRHLGYRKGSGRVFDSPDADVLDGIALAVNGAWIRGPRSTVLCERESFSELAGSPLAFTDQVDRSLGRITGVTPRQMVLLQRRGWLALGDFTTSQMQGLKSFAEAKYLVGSEIGPDPELIGGTFLTLGLSREQGADGTRTQTIELHAPGLDGELHRQFATELGPADPNLPAGYYQRRPQPSSLGLIRFPVSREDGEPVDLSTDSRLSQPLPVSLATAGAALDQVAQATKASILAGTQLEYCQVRFKGQPPTSREVLERVAAVTGGRWRRIGSVLVLQPHPALEKVVQWSGHARENWAAEAVATVQRGLIGRRLKRLKEERKLGADELSKEQQNALQWLVAVQFLARAGEDPDALALKGVSLEWHPASSQDAKKGVPGSVRYLVPSLDGTPRQVAEAPLR